MVKAYMPQNLEEALEIIKNEKVIIVSGGAWHMNKRRNWACLPTKFQRDIVAIGNLKEIKEIKIENNKLRMGAACTLNEIIESKDIPIYIKDVMRNIASPAIRNRATIGGNVCISDYDSDTLPILYALNAKLLLKSKGKERVISIQNFIKGWGINTLAQDEMLTEIIIGFENFHTTVYKKIKARGTNAYSKVSFVGLAKMKNKEIEDIRIAFGAVAKTVIRDRSIEEKLIGLNQNEMKNIIDIIKDMYSIFMKPVGSPLTTKLYRKEVSLRLLEDFLLNEIWR